MNVIPTVETPSGAVTPPQPTPTASETPATTGQTAGQNIADVVRNEGRRDKATGTGNPTVQTAITSEDVTNAMRQGAEEGTRSALHDLPRTIAEAVQGVVNAVLTSGVAVGGDGVSLGAGSAAADQINRDVAESLQAEGSFRSDVVPTLLGNQPGTVQPGSADPDDETVAQAPAAVRQGSLLTAAALEGLATESTLASLTAHAAAIAANTGLLAELPLITSLAGQGVSVEDAQSRLNLGERQTDLLTLLQSAQSLASPTPDLSQIAGVSESNPLYVVDTSRPEVQKVEVMNKVQTETEVKGTVDVKQVGVVQVTQSGEWVMRLASGETIPVYVQGGQLQTNLSQGGISTLAELIDVENQRRDAFNTAI